MPIQVVNIIPRTRSGETQADSEPNLAVNPENPQQIVASAFTIDTSAGPNRAPIYVSNDGGNTWTMSLIVPSQGGTRDISIAFGSGNTLYAGIIPNVPDPFGTVPPGLNILRTNSLFGPAPMKVLVERRGNGVDQPYIEAIRIPAGTSNTDVVAIGSNDFNQPNRRTATLDYSKNAAATTPAFRSAGISARSAIQGGQDAPSVRPAIHQDGTMYGAFLHQVGRTPAPESFQIYDVVVVRDDALGQGASPFGTLTDSDNRFGKRVVRNRVIPFINRPALGQERIGSSLSLVVDPRPGQSGTVYLAWADLVAGQPASYTVHLRRSTDRGKTWSNDLLTLPNSTNPALAINSDGTVGFLYQQVTGPVTLGVVQPTNRWQTHLRRAADGTAFDDIVLANCPANTPPAQGLPYLGDYVRLLAIGRDFYGIFSANNRPDNDNFPQGVKYQRNANFTARRLLALDNVTGVPVSIDPFFFKVTP
jgi:hypothetical protein